MRKPHISIPKNELIEFCNSNHIKKLALFGSVLTDHFTSSSDVDFLVQFEKDNIPSLFGIARMESELEDLLGRKVDLRTAEDLSPYFRDQVVQEAYLLYGK
jgi:predicted nucleotidyltransferase